MADLLKTRIAERIRALRLEREMTQEQVARRVGVTWRHYQRWEKGESTPYWPNIEKLADAFGVSANEIIDPLGSSLTTEGNVNAKIGEMARQIADLQSRVHKLTLERAKANRKASTNGD